MKFLALIARKPAIREDDIEPFLEPEAERVRQLYTQGVIRSAFSRGDVKGAVLELECADLDAARRTVETLPFWQQKMIDFEVVPLLPYRGFAPRNG
jgi:hypothetical protein